MTHIVWITIAIALYVLAMPVMAGESEAPMTCQLGTVEEFTQFAGDAPYQPLERVARDRLITFLAWTGRPAAKAEHAWQWRYGEHIVVIFANSPCIVGYVTMDEPTFTAVVEGWPLPLVPPAPTRKPTSA